MKIDTLRFKNINSLKGEWKVSFNQPPLVDAGVFAITGPNGAGKTSIIDAITLGLYGETFKFDHPSNHVITKQTDESFAEVVFSLDGEQFRSSWSVQRKEGRLASPEMQIVRLNGNEEVIEDQPGKVRTFIAELTGMDFRRFTRSIVLAQGDFAAFLNALDNERLDILEKIVGTNIYDDYKQDILDKAENEQNTLKQLRRDLVEIPLKSPEEIEALEHDLIDFKAQSEEFKEQRDTLEQHYASVQTLEEAKEAIAELEQSVEQVLNESNEIQQEIATIEAVQDFKAIESGVEELAHKQQQLASSEQTLLAYRNELTQLENTIGQLTLEDRQKPDLGSQSVTEQIENLGSLKYQLGQLKIDCSTETELLATREEQLQTKQLSHETVTAWLQEHQTDQVLLESFPNIEGLKNVRNEIVSIKEQKAAHIKKAKAWTSMTKKKEAEAGKLKREVERLQEGLQKQQTELKSLLKDQTLEQIEEELAEYQERLANYKGLVVIAGDYSKLPKPKSSSSLLGFIGTKGEQEREGPAAEYETLLEVQEQENNILETLEKAVVWEARLKKHEAERQLLVDGEACPLCGSTEHPFTKNPPESVDSTKALADQQKKVSALEKKAEQLVTKIKASHTVRQEATDKNKLRKELESYWLELCTRLNMVSEDFTINDLKAAKKLLAEHNKTIAEYSSRIKNHDLISKKIERQQSLLEKKISDQEAAILEQEQINASEDINPQELKTLELTLTDSTQEEQDLTTAVTEQLLSLGEKLPTKGKEDKLLERLQQRQQAYQEKLEQQQTLQQELTALAQQVENSRTKSQRLNQQLEECTNSLHSSEVASLHLALVEKQKLIAENEQQQEQQKQVLQTTEQQVKTTLEATGVSDVEAAEKLIEGKHHIPDMQQKLTGLEEQSQQLNQKIEHQKTELTSLQEDVKTTLSLEEIGIQQKQVSSKLSIANQEIRSTESILAQQNSLQTKVNNLQEKVQEQVKVAEQCQSEVSQLQSESEADFRRKIQQQMIDQLMTKSNQFLEKISGRYCVHQTETEQGLALEVEDKAEGNIRRSPKTLSGGESFVVSLSLALGLSGMANQGRSVDSLFLDEGFGTLDEETLYVVLSTLESLHHSGKMVGVISHVKELKERIRTQIRLSKEKNGHSSLEIVS